MDESDCCDDLPFSSALVNSSGPSPLLREVRGTLLLLWKWWRSFLDPLPNGGNCLRRHGLLFRGRHAGIYVLRRDQLVQLRILRFAGDNYLAYVHQETVIEYLDA